MAGLIPMCDSDEEVFYGPITAREIELDWRRLMAEKENKRLDPTDQPASNSGEILNQSSSSAANNEPLKESSFKSNSIRFIDDDGDDTMDVDAESSLAINRSVLVKISEGENNDELKVVEANYSGLIEMSFKESDTTKDGNISTVSHLLENTTDHIDKVSSPRLETCLKDSTFAEGDNTLAKPAMEHKNDQTANDVSEFKLNDGDGDDTMDVDAEPSLAINRSDLVKISEGESNDELKVVESSNNKSMPEIGVRMNDTTINELIISKEDENTSVIPNNLNDGTYHNVAEVSGLSLNEISIKDSSISVYKINASVVPTSAEDSGLKMDEITGLRWNGISDVSNFDVGLNNTSVTFNMEGIDQNRIEITDVSFNEKSVKGYNDDTDDKNTLFRPQMGGNNNQTTAEVVHETNVMSNIVEDANNTSSMLSNLDATDQYMTEVPEVRIFKQNVNESQIGYMPTYTEDTIVQNLGENTSLKVNETSLMESNVAECDMNASARLTNVEDSNVQNISKITDAILKGTNMECNDCEEENNASVIAEGGLTVSAMLTNKEDCIDQSMDVVTNNVRLNETNVMEPNVAESENNASVIAEGELTVSAMLTNAEDCIDQNMGLDTNVRLNETNVMEPNVAESENNASSMVTNTEVTSAEKEVVFIDAVKLNETNAHNSEENVSANLTYGEVSGVQSMTESTGVGLNETNVLESNVAESENNASVIAKGELTVSAMLTNAGDCIDQNMALDTNVRLNETNVMEPNVAESENNASSMVTNTEVTSAEKEVVITDAVKLNETNAHNSEENVSANLTYGEVSGVQSMTETTGVGLNETNVLESNVAESFNNISGMLKNIEVSSVHNVSAAVAFGLTETSVMEGNVEGEKEAPAMLSIVEDMTCNEQGTDNFCSNKSQSWERVADQCKLEVSSLILNETSLLLDTIAEQNNSLTVLQKVDDTEVQIMEVTNTIELNGIAKVVDQISCENNASPQLSLSGVISLALDQKNIVSEDNIVMQELSENKSESSDSSEKSFVSLKSYEELSCEDKCAESMLYVPPNLDATDQYMTEIPGVRIFKQNVNESHIGYMPTYTGDTTVQNLSEITSVKVNETSLMESNVAECDMNASARLTNVEDSNVQNISKITDAILKGTNMECNDEEENNASIIAEGGLTVLPTLTNTEDCIDQSMDVVTNVRLNETNVMEPNVAESLNNVSAMLKNTEVSSVHNVSAAVAFGLTETSVMEGNVEGEKEAPTRLSIVEGMTCNEQGTDNFCSNKSQSWERVADQCKLEVSSLILNETSLLLDSIAEQNNSLTVLQKVDDTEVQIMEVTNTIELNGIAKVVDQISCENNASPQLSLGGVISLALDQKNIVSEDNIVMQELSENKSESSDSSEKSFVSLKSYEEVSSEDKCAEGMLYVPPGKKKCIQSTPGKENFTQSNSCKNKEIEDSKSRIPVPSASRLPVLRPPTLKLDNFVNTTPWASDFRKKKIPQPKKPAYVVSPGKLDRILKTTPVNKQIRPRTADSGVKNTPTIPLKCSSSNISTPNIASTPQLSGKLISPSSLKQFPGLTKKKVDTPLKTSPKNTKFKDITSPVAEYIKHPPSLIRNVTPTKGNICAISTGKNKENRENAVKSPKPEVFISPKYYSSASRRVLTSSSINKSPVLPKMGERQTAVLSASPKVQILKHTGRILSGGKNLGEETILRPTRKTSLSNTSFAGLPPSSDLDVSTVQKL